MPSSRIPVYGERALDVVFDFEGIAGGRIRRESLINNTDMDVPSFFGIVAPRRITTLSTSDIILEHLIHTFGDLPQFTKDIAENMNARMRLDLQENRKEEYMSHLGKKEL